MSRTTGFAIHVGGQGHRDGRRPWAGCSRAVAALDAVAQQGPVGTRERQSGRPGAPDHVGPGTRGPHPSDRVDPNRARLHVIRHSALGSCGSGPGDGPPSPATVLGAMYNAVFLDQLDQGFGLLLERSHLLFGVALMDLAVQLLNEPPDKEAKAGGGQPEQQ